MLSYPSPVRRSERLGSNEGATEGLHDRQRKKRVGEMKTLKKDQG